MTAKNREFLVRTAPSEYKGSSPVLKRDLVREMLF